MEGVYVRENVPESILAVITDRRNDNDRDQVTCYS